jgi:hypothetical protein
MMARLDSTIEVFSDLAPDFRRPADLGDAQARLALFAAIQEFESKAALLGGKEQFPPRPLFQRVRRNQDLVEAGVSLVAIQLKLAEMRGADQAQQRSVLQRCERLRERRASLADKLEAALASRELDLIPLLRTESEQIASEARSLVQSTWALLGGADSWMMSGHGPQIDEIMAKSDELLQAIRTRVRADADAEPRATGLRSLLARKAALLRDTALRLGIATLLGVETGADARFVKVLRDLMQVELELCGTREERLRVCTHHVRLAAELAKQAEANWQSGRTPGWGLTGFKLHLLDTEILLLREQTRRGGSVRRAKN